MPQPQHHERAVPAQRGDEETLFRRHHPKLLWIVRARVMASDEVIEDACTFAWIQLLRLQPDRMRDGRVVVLAWLARVAEREAWRLARYNWKQGAHLHRDANQEPLPEPIDPKAEMQGLEDLWDALDSLDQLPERKRRMLFLQGLGYSYREIGAITGDSFRTVDRQVARAKAQLRQLGRQD